jgi:hypothetical protein
VFLFETRTVVSTAKKSAVTSFYGFNSIMIDERHSKGTPSQELTARKVEPVIVFSSHSPVRSLKKSGSEILGCDFPSISHRLFALWQWSL